MKISIFGLAFLCSLIIYSKYFSTLSLFDKLIPPIIPGKFTLAFSLAPEFYRLVYNKNPRKFFATHPNTNTADIIDETVWGEVQGKIN